MDSAHTHQPGLVARRGCSSARGQSSRGRQDRALQFDHEHDSNVRCPNRDDARACPRMAVARSRQPTWFKIVKLVLLPGMDGTGELFAPFLSALGSSWESLVFRYPA